MEPEAGLRRRGLEGEPGGGVSGEPKDAEGLCVGEVAAKVEGTGEAGKFSREASAAKGIAAEGVEGAGRVVVARVAELVE